MSTWKFFTHHTLVLALINHNNRVTAREIASNLQITERTVLRVISELENDGFIRRHKEGRINHYEINLNQLISHPPLRTIPVSELLRVLSLTNAAE